MTDISQELLEAKKDVERMEWLIKNVQEKLLRPGTLSSDFPDMRTHWVFPTLMCSGPIGGFQSLREAIDIQIEHEKSQKQISTN